MAAALALGTSLAYGISNWIGPRLARDAPLMVLLVVGQGCSFLLAFGVVGVQGEAPPGLEAVGWATLAGLGNAGGLVLFYRAAQHGPLSIVVPIGSLGAVLPVAAGWAGGEEISVAKVLGVLLALGGVSLVARRPDRSGPSDADRRLAILLAALSAVCFGVFLAAIGPAADEHPAWAVTISRAALLAVLLVLVAHEGGFERVAVRRLPLLAVPGLLLFAGTIAYATATTKGDLSVVSVLGTLFPVVTVGLAIAFDGERLRPAQGAGVIAAIIGVVLLSLR